MYIYLRLIKVLYYALRAKTCDLTTQEELHFRVWPNDLDFNFHMNNSRFLLLMDLGRIDLFARGGLIKLARQHKWRPILGSCTIRFRRSLEPFERYTLRTAIKGWDEKWFFIQQTFIKADGNTAALALVRGCITGPKGIVPPQEILGLLGHTAPSPQLPIAFVEWCDADEKLWTDAARSS